MRCVGWAPAFWIARALSRLPQRWILALSGPLAWLLAPLLRERERVAARNLALCFPELDASARERLLRANLRETVIGVFELLRAWYAPDALLRDAAQVEGIEHLREALASGQGVLLFTGHFTQTELAARLLGQALGRRLHPVVRRHNRPCVEAEFERARRRVFEPSLAKKDVRGMLRALQSGGAVVYSADQDFNYQNVFVPFFGVPAATLTGTPELVRRSGARMLAFWFHRDPQGRYRIRLTPAWPGWGESGPEASAEIYMRELEAVVREHPEQYLWVHRRFKTRPAGEASLY